MNAYEATLEVTSDMNPGLPAEACVTRAGQGLELLWDRGYVLVSAKRQISTRLLPWAITGVTFLMFGAVACSTP